MIKAIQKRLKNNKGFTLVELVVVIAILGVLAAIAVPRFIGVQDGVKETADVATAKSIANATELAIVQGETVTGGEIDADHVLVTSGYLDGVPEAQVDDQDGFKVIVGSDGSITVTYNDSDESPVEGYEEDPPETT